MTEAERGTCLKRWLIAARMATSLPALDYSFPKPFLAHGDIVWDIVKREEIEGLTTEKTGQGHGFIPEELGFEQL